MAIMERPKVETLSDGGKYWEHEYEDFYLKAYIPKTQIDGTVNNYTFKQPLLLIFEEVYTSKEEAINFANKNGFADIAADYDSSVLFVYPKCAGGWKGATESLYAAVIKQVKMTPEYRDGITEYTDFFKNVFMGYSIRGAIFRADVYSYGESADYVATNLLKKIDGEYLWGPGEITPAMCSMEGLSVIPQVERRDIAIISVGNSETVNSVFKESQHMLIKDKAEYKADFKNFVRKFKMWCGQQQIEVDFDAIGMTEEAGVTEVNTSKDNKRIKTPKHKIGYFAYYNNDLFENGPVPLLIGFHGGGDSSMYLSYVAQWWEICHRYGFLFVSLENHQFIPATEVAEVIENLKKKYNIDEKRIYATGFSMGSGKTWEMYQEYPEIFAGLAPVSAMFPVKNHFLSQSNSGRLNMDVSVPLFYSGGECSFVTELPCMDESGLERIQYIAKVNKLKAKFDISFDKKDEWADPIWGVSGDRVEVVHDDSRGSDLKIHYYESEDGICRTAFASVTGQVHECRHHSCEEAWKFISLFEKSTK